MKAILNILSRIQNNKAGVEIEYKRVVKAEGNPEAIKQISETFQTEDSIWRGLGAIPESGLKIKNDFSGLDAKTKYPTGDLKSKEPRGCICGDILKGIKKPIDCKLFAKMCNPDNPVGPFMVSSEGLCAAYFKYRCFN